MALYLWEWAGLVCGCDVLFFVTGAGCASQPVR